MRRRWYRRPPRQWPRRRTQTPLPGRRRRLTVAAELGTLLAVLIGLLALFLPKGLPLPWGGGDAATPRLVLRQSDPVNDRYDLRPAANGEAPTRRSLPQVDLTVENTGSGLALLTSARVTIEDSAQLQNCYVPGGGDVPAAPPEVFMLSPRPLPDERVIERPLHRKVESRAVDRVVLAFAVPPTLTANLFAIRVELRTGDPDRTLDAGRFLLSVPDPVGRGGSMFPEDDLVLEQAGKLDVTQTWCYLANLAAARRLIAQEGKRSKEVDALRNVRFASSWEAHADSTPAAEAAEALLRDSDGPGPLYATFAAETAGDPAVVAQIRVKAAELLRRRAERALDDEIGLAGAVTDARTAASLAPSKEASLLVERAERLAASQPPMIP